MSAADATARRLRHINPAVSLEPSSATVSDFADPKML